MGGRRRKTGDKFKLYTFHFLPANTDTCHCTIHALFVHFERKIQDLDYEEIIFCTIFPLVYVKGKIVLWRAHLCWGASRSSGSWRLLKLLPTSVKDELWGRYIARGILSPLPLFLAIHNTSLGLTAHRRGSNSTKNCRLIKLSVKFRGHFHYI